MAIQSNPDNDMWWMMATGRYILENKEIPTTNPFVIHKEFGMIVQQWLLAVINFLLYNTAGKWGLVGFSIVSFGCNMFLMWKFTGYYTTKKKNRLIALFIGMLLCGTYLNTRPTQLTIGILLIEQIAILKWKETKECKYLWIIPFLSIIEINLHAALWPYLFIMALPHLVPDILGQSKENIFTQIKDKKALFLPLIATFFSGFFNPNGINGVFYLTKSYNSGEVFQYISEMQSPAIWSVFGIGIIGAVLLFAAYLSKTQRKNRDISVIYMFAGVILLAMMHLRNMWTLLFGILPVLCLLLSENVLKEIPNKEEKTTPFRERAEFVFSIVAFVLILVAEILLLKDVYVEKDSTLPIAAADYLDQKEETENIILYTTFNTGGYMEWRGYKVYVDARPELFQKKINGKEDIADEYMTVERGTADYKAFLNKYQFTHMLVDKNSFLDMYLQITDNYKIVCQDENYLLYEKE